MRAATLGAILVATLPAIVSAADKPLSFADPATQTRFEALLEELRCLVCQNQSLADSHADLAQDLRDEVYRMVDAGHDNSAVVDFMVQRYGDFALYRPPVRSTTWLLWGAPLVMLLLALVIVARRPGSGTAAPALDSNERARLEQLLGGDHDKQPEHTSTEQDQR